MLHLESHGDVVRLAMSTRVSRAAGYGVSAYFVRGVLIDTGFPVVAHEVAAWLDQARPRGVVLTHSHEDHAGNAELVARRGIPIAAGLATLNAIRAPEDIGFTRRLLWGRVPPLVSPIALFNPDGLVLLPTPGHARDHMVVWDAERETLFAGDLFLGVKVRAAHPGEDVRQLVQSVRRVAALRPKRMFDAHRGIVPDPVASLTAKADWMEETIAAVEDRIARGWSDRAIVRDVLGREDSAYYMTRGAMSKINFVRAARGGVRAAGRAVRDVRADVHSER
ncbi:MAG TPA: MBL fold metallo-hydrolase [Gemmatimonadaceae bacterium]